MKPIYLLRTFVVAAILLLQFLPFAAKARAASGDVDLSFDPGSGGWHDVVSAIAMHADGKLIVGGGGVARINADGSRDSSFTLEQDPNSSIGQVAAIALLGDGKVLVGHANGIDRLNPDGSQDPSFTKPVITNYGGTPAGLNAMVVCPDGKILIGGGFRVINGQIRSSMARLHAGGSLDASFVPGTSDQDFAAVFSIVLEPDGKALIAGQFITPRNDSVARVNTDGTLDEDTFFSVKMNALVRSTALQPDGKLIAGDSGGGITRLNRDGSLDSAFNAGAGADGPILAVVLQADGKVLIGGHFTKVRGIDRSRIARLNTDGTLDTTFDPGPGPHHTIAAMAVLPDARMLIGGGSDNPEIAHEPLIRLHADGSQDGTFITEGTGIGGEVYSLLPQLDGKVLISGNFSRINRTPLRGHIARLNGDGSFDSAFDPGGPAGQFVPQPDGKMIVFTPWMHWPKSIVRFNADWSVDESFGIGSGAGGDLPFYCVASLPDGRLLVGGQFESFDGTRCNGIARLNTEGRVDSTYSAQISSHTIWSIVVQPDGKALIGGEFSSADNQKRHAVARLNADGTADASFNAEVAGDVRQIILQPDGKVLIRGLVSTPGRLNRPLARLHADGSVDGTFDSGAAFDEVPGVADAGEIALTADGKLLVDGVYSFENNDGIISGMFRLNPDGSLDGSFLRGTTNDARINAFAFQGDGRILIGGGFNSVNGVSRPGVARLFGDSGGPPNIPPSVAISSPVDGAGFVQGDTISLRANASDADGTVERVDFYLGTALIGSDIGAPFAVTWDAEQAGSYAITAIATDNSGATATSAAVNISVARMNQVPMAGADSATTAYQTAVEIHVLANDSDPDGDALAITGTSNPAHGTVQVVATSGGPRIRYTPAAGYSGSDSFTYGISDGFGGGAVGAVTVQITRPKAPKKISKGGAVTGAGDSSSGVPAGATWKTFGVPSIASDGSIAFGATVSTAEGIVPLVYLASSEDLEEDATALVEYAVAKKGDPAPGVAGATFASFKDPLLNAEGTVVFAATLRGGSAGTNGGIWKHYAGEGAGASTLVAQLGAEPAGVPGARWKAFTSVAVSDGAAGKEVIAFTATMASGTGGVRSANDLGLWIADAHGVTLALREGATLMVGATAKKVKSFVALQSVPGAAGQGNGATASGVLARVKFQDGTHAVVRVSIGEDKVEITALARTGDPAGELAADFATFGLSAQSPNGWAAFTTTLTLSDRQSDTAIFQSTGTGIEVIAREGDPALAEAPAVFSSFTGLANDSTGRVAFTARLRGAGVNATNHCAIFLQEGDSRALVARKGEQPPGVLTGAKWGSFPSVALPDGAAGPIFVAKLLTPAPGKPNPARINGRNNVGVWATDSAGELRLIVRVGDAFDAQRTITGLALLGNVLCSPAQARSFTGAGDLIYRATLSDGSQHVVTAVLP